MRNLRILSFWFVQHWDSSAYKSSKFVHKIRHVAIKAYFYRSLAQHTTSSGLVNCSQVKTPPTASRFVINTTSAATRRSDSSVQQIHLYIKVMELALIGLVAENGDHSHQCGRGFSVTIILSNGRRPWL